MNNPSKYKVVVALPAYNEEKYIGSLVIKARRHANEVLVVDDGSHDQTAFIAESAGATVIRHNKNKGYGSAIQNIFSETKKRTPDVLVILDADAQHDPDEIDSLVQAVLGGFDIAIGSRKLQHKAIPAFRRFGQRVLSRLTAIASRKKIYDTESGFRAYSRKAIDQLILKEQGMAISAEIVTEASRVGLSIAEVPISITYSNDSSTINPMVHGMSVFNRVLVMISERRSLLVFGIVGTILIAFGIILGILVIQQLQEFQILQVGSALLSMLFITIGILNISTGLILSLIARRFDYLNIPSSEK